MIKVILLGFLIFMIFTASSKQPILADQYQVSYKLKKPEPLMKSKNIQITQVNLIAREENTAPIGIPNQPNRDIGFASAFLKLENNAEKNQMVIIQNIEIRNLSDGQLQSFSFVPKQIELKPLENSEIAFHLTNKTGYSGQGQVKAIITYQIGEKINIIESESVEINKR